MIERVIKAPGEARKWLDTDAEMAVEKDVVKFKRGEEVVIIPINIYEFALKCAQARQSEEATRQHLTEVGEAVKNQVMLPEVTGWQVIENPPKRIRIDKRALVVGGGGIFTTALLVAVLQGNASPEGQPDFSQAAGDLGSAKIELMKETAIATSEIATITPMPSPTPKPTDKPTPVPATATVETAPPRPTQSPVVDVEEDRRPIKNAGDAVLAAMALALGAAAVAIGKLRQ